MPALIHLNGPACVGKSTLAMRMIEERPLALCLDVDELRVLVAAVDELVARLDADAIDHPRAAFTRDELRGQMLHSLELLPRLIAERSYARVVDVTGMSVDGALAAVWRAVEGVTPLR